MRKELLEGLSEAQIERASRCKNAEELFALAKEEGVELTPAQLEYVNGGCGNGPKSHVATCPKCNTLVTGEYVETTPGDNRYEYICPECGYNWMEK